MSKKEDLTMQNLDNKIKEGFYYLTQYDTAGRFDDAVINALKEGTKEIDRDSLAELLAIVPNVSDTYNEALYNALMRGAVNDDNINDLIATWEALKDNDLEEALNILGADIYDILNSYDVSYGTPDDFEQWADDDLKANGINAQSLSWANNIYYDANYLVLYFNGEFRDYDSLTDILENETDINNVFEDALNDFLGD